MESETASKHFRLSLRLFKWCRNDDEPIAVVIESEQKITRHYATPASARWKRIWID